jgi:MoxR-like ATPase
VEIEEVASHATALRGELARAVVGQDDVLDQVLVALLAGGHVLLEGPPGTAKTLLVRALSLALTGTFRRIQFTPDLLPADIVGVNVFRPDLGRFEFAAGPVACDLLLADEINRAPAKTQSALLEAMQERQVSVDGTTYPLSGIFTVFATQNPVEHEGTYPLPEAQLDRFLFKTLVGYPSKEEEDAVLARVHAGFDSARPETFGVVAVASPERLLSLRDAVRRVQFAPEIIGYVTSVVRATRGYHLLSLGASPRASVMLLLASKARAALRGSSFTTPDDVKDCCLPVLRHRVVLTPEAEIEGVTADDCLRQVLERVDVPRL